MERQRTFGDGKKNPVKFSAGMRGLVLLVFSRGWVWQTRAWAWAQDVLVAIPAALGLGTFGLVAELRRYPGMTPICLLASLSRLDHLPGPAATVNHIDFFYTY